MMNLRIYNTLTVAVLGVVLSTLFIGCTREEDDLPEASFPQVGEIFTNDSFVGLGTNFFFPFIDGGAKPDVFDVDLTEGYVGTSSIRIDVPDGDDPGGSFAGATFIIDGFGRNLTEYNALTFWARASQSAEIAEFGFGVNADGSPYQTSASNLKLATNWQQYIIPIPDPSKLVNEKGMMWFAASGVCPAGDGQCFPESFEGDFKKGFTFWLDEVQFENLGTIGQPRAEIQNGEDVTVAAFVGQVLEVTGVNVSFNMPNGIDLDLNTGPAFFDYTPSTPGVVSTAGSTLTVVGEGTTTVTAKMGDIDAAGSLTVQTISESPEPTRDAQNVISVFSDNYDNVPVDFFNGFFIPDGQTTLGGAIETAPGKNIIYYTDLNFVIPTFTNPTIDASEMTHLHLDIFTFDDTEDAQLEVGLVDLGDDANFGGGNDVAGRFFLEGAGFVTGEWISLDIRLDEFDGLGATSNLGQLILVSEKIDNLIMDNIYFYKESPAQDASLSDITVNGVSINGFASGILTYPVDVPSSGVVPNVEGTPNNEDAQVSVTPASSVPGTTTITVTAANGVTTRTYNVEFSLSDIADVTLNDLQVDGTTITDFSPATTSYVIDLPDGTTMVPMVTATANDPEATVTITDATEIPGTTLVVVTGRDGTTQSTYRVTLNAGDAQAPVELITNGDFESGNDGSWYGNAANIQTEGGNSFNFADVGQAGNPFDVNMSQLVTLQPGQDYTLTFEASTSPEIGSRTIIVGIGQSADPFFANTEEITLTSETQTFTLNLSAIDDGSGSEFGDATSRVIFDLGADVGVVVIDNVSLLGGSGGSTPPDPDPDPNPTPTELVTNGDFESGSDGSWYGNAANIQTEGGNSFNFADIGQAGNPFDVNMSQLVTLQPGEDYTLTFEASTSPETGTRTMIVGIGQSADPFFANTEEITLTSETQTFTLNLSAIDDGTGSEFGDATSRVIFDMGADVGVVVIDNVSLLGAGSGGATPDPDPDPDPDADPVPDPTPTELVINGDFESGDDGSWSGNAFNIQTEGGNSFNFADVAVAGNPFDVNLSQVLEITQGTTYTLTFEASTGAGSTRTLIAGIGLNEGAFTAATEEVTLTETNETFTLILSASDFGSANSRILFDMGADTGVVVIDNVSLVRN